MKLKLIIALIFTSCVGLFSAPKGYTGNPILAGTYADPAMVCYDGVYYIYSTSNGSACVWYSKDFKNWRVKNLRWPTSTKLRNQWAPCMRIIGKYFYLFYSLDSQIYVGKSDSPLGPFKNIKGQVNGKEIPFIKNREFFPKIHTIDADVFVDDDNKAYIYWGSGLGFKDGVCAFAELKADVSGFKTTPKEITPKGFFEGSHMLKRNGKYYLMYSDGIYFNDTYCVKYAVSDKPEGPFVYGKNNPILETHFPTRTYGPGHHSTIKIGEKYYIVYHKMEYPRMFEGRSGSRQTCIDELRFDDDGNILKVIPTKTGVELDILKNAKSENQIFPIKIASSKSSGKTPNYYKPEFAFDDSFDTIWEPDTRQKHIWIAGDFGETKDIVAFEPIFAEVRENVIYKIETSNANVENIADVKDWQLYGEFKNGDVKEWPHRIQKPVKARFIRLSVINFNSRAGIWEFKVFAK